MRIGVTGGRGFAASLDNHEMVLRSLQVYDRRDNILVHGGAKGADMLAADVWTGLGGACERHDADWTGPCRDTCAEGHRRYEGQVCPAAGVYRNQEMVDSGLDVLIAFPGGRGTNDMVRRAREAGVPVVDLRDRRPSESGGLVARSPAG